MILHIVSKTEWHKAKRSSEYRGDTLQSEGFIHCSKPEQVIVVANARFRGRQDLVLVVIDPEKVRSEIRYEDNGHGEFFPHIYGPLNLEAVIGCVDFLPEGDGCFALPSKLFV